MAQPDIRLVPTLIVALTALSSPIAKAQFVSEPPTQEAVAAPAAPCAPITEPASDRAPRLYELRLVGAWAPRAELPLSSSNRSIRPFGTGVGLRMGWRVGGLRSGSASWVGFDMQGVAQPARDARESLVVSYGIFAKHAFMPSRTVHPFISYGLGAAQLWVIGVDGHGIGHSTRLGIGVDVDLSRTSSVGVAIVYAATRLATFASTSDSAHSSKIDQLELDVTFAFESGRAPAIVAR